MTLSKGDAAAVGKTPEQVRAIVEELKALYPDSLCSLQYEKDYELLFAVRLAAQCTDERVNQVTPALYARFPTLEALAGARPGTSSCRLRCCCGTMGAGCPVPWRSC